MVSRSAEHFRRLATRKSGGRAGAPHQEQFANHFGIRSKFGVPPRPAPGVPSDAGRHLGDCGAVRCDRAIERFWPDQRPAYLEGISSSVRSSLLGQADYIVLKVDAEPLSILPDHAVPLGLIGNELATNAIKYAFQGGRGEVVLGFQRRDGEVARTVSDNGGGMTKGTETGLGTRFVEAFVRQLGGTMATGTSSKEDNVHGPAPSLDPGGE